jgi:hypothetical protein
LEFLENFISRALKGEIEPLRLARVVATMLWVETIPNVCLLNKSSEFLRNTQLPDGGWSDPEETGWSLAALSKIDTGQKEAIQKGINWLNSDRHIGGGWGRHPRDQVRILTTALVLTLVPSVVVNADRKWVRQAWEKDLNSPVRLSYKGGFYLLTVKNENEEQIDPLVLSTIAYLADDQNEDGGFGPWRDHPIGSDPWSTGVVLWGLSKWIDNVDPIVIEKALAWLERTQLPSGYWPYHFLDEGTSYALIGAVAASRAMETRK